MFESLADRLHGIFRNLRGQGRLSEANMKTGLREIRQALLEADVHFRVARDFLRQIEKKALGQEVLNSLTPAQQLVKMVHDGMTELLGGEHLPLRRAPRPPTVVLMVGLQGCGKTTTVAKLGLSLSKQGFRPLLVPADLSRPAAVEQLQRMGEKAGVAVFQTPPGAQPAAAARDGVSLAGDRGHDVAIVDTAGRLHVDDRLMAELKNIRERTAPHEVLYVADAMTGQDAVASAGRFHQEIGLTGVILSKMDGDARGGSALSIRAVTGVPIRFVGVGEKVADLEPFHPQRVASRILGMGDVLTLIEKAEEVTEAGEQERLAKKMRKAQFSLEDFRDQLRKIRRMGPLDQLVKMLPGSSHLPLPPLEGRELTRTEAIINSMTPGERKDHTVLNGSRRRRIARGSGTTVQEVNRLLKQFAAIQRFLKQGAGRMDRRALRKLGF